MQSPLSFYEFLFLFSSEWLDWNRPGVNASTEMHALSGHRLTLYHLGAAWSIWGGKLNVICYLWGNIKERERERKTERHGGFKSWLLFIAALVFARRVLHKDRQRQTDNEGEAKWQMVWNWNGKSEGASRIKG